LTCKNFNVISKENEIWKNLYFKDYDMFLFFDNKDRCIVEHRAYLKYEEKKEINDNDNKYKNLNFKEKYLELKRINKNWEENRPIITTISTSECVTCLNLNNNSNELIFSSVDGSAALYRLYSFRKIASDEEIYMQHHKQTRICDKLSTFYGHGGPIWCIDRHQDVLFTGSYDKTIKLWDIKSGQCISTMRNHSSWVSSIQYDPLFDKLISGSWDCTIRLWNMKTLQNSLTLNSQNGNFIYCVRSNLADNEVIAGTEFKTVDVWDVNKGVKTNIFYGHLERITNIKYVSANKNMILTGSEDKQARLWDKRTGNCEILFTGHSRGITQVEIDMCNNRVFTASIDKSIKIWDIRKNKEVRTLVGHSSSVYSIAFDQTKLISGSKDNSIKIWNFLY
jgi:WD40 repeat protein